jgi:hypothetical protein
MTDSHKDRVHDARGDLSIDQDGFTPPNPEVEHVDAVAARTKVAHGGNEMSTVHHRSNPRLSIQQNVADGAVYVTRNVPDMVVEVLPGQNVVVGNDDHEVSVPGSYFGGDQLKCHGPTAHMLEARGFVRVLGVAAVQCSKPVEPEEED